MAGMVQTLESRELATGGSFGEQYARAFRYMLLARILDEKLASLYRGGKIHGGVFLGRGQEALSVSLGMALRKGAQNSAGKSCFVDGRPAAETTVVIDELVDQRIIHFAHHEMAGIAVYAVGERSQLPVAEMRRQE